MSEKTAIIKPCAKKDIDPDRPMSEQKVCLYSKKNPGELLGRHPDEESAKKQEQAIQISKHAAKQISDLILEGKGNEVTSLLRQYEAQGLSLFSDEGETERTANIKAVQTYILYEVAKRIVNYAKGKRLQKYADKVWVELFSRTFQISTRGSLNRGQEGGQYKIEGQLIFTNGDTNRPIRVLIVSAYWKFKPTVLFQLFDRNKKKPIFSILNKDTKKVIKAAKTYISENLIFPPITSGDYVQIESYPHKGRIGIVHTYQPMTQRLLVQLSPVQDEEPVSVWFDRDQVTLMTDKNIISKQFQAAIDLLYSSHPDLAERVAETKEKYEAQTDLEKMIGEMTYGQSGIWLTKDQMKSIVKELHKQGVKSPKDGTYDDIAQAVGKMLDKLLPDSEDQKDEKKKEDQKGKYKAQTDLEKMIGEMTYGQSGIWLTKDQMKSIVKDLHNQGVKSPKDKTYDEIAQAVGKMLDKLIPDEDDQKSSEMNEDKEEKTSSILNPLTRQVFTILQRDYGFIDAHKNDPEEVDATWFKLDYVEDTYVKNGSLLLGDKDILLPNYVDGNYATKDLDITMVHPVQGRAFDVLTVPTFGNKPATMILDFGRSRYHLTAKTAEGLASEIAVIAADQNFLRDERIALKIEVEVEIEIDPKDLKEMSESEESEESEERKENTSSDEQEEQEESREIPLDQEEQSEPMVLDPNTLVEAPQENDSIPENAREFGKPILPPVPFPWSR